MNRKFHYFTISVLLGLALAGAMFGVAPNALAQTAGNSANTGLVVANDLGINYATATGLGTTDIRLTAARIIRAVLGFLGIVAVVIILYGGFAYMTAGGNEEKVAEAKKVLINGVIGLIIILSAFSIASFVVSKLIGATTDGGQNGGVGLGDDSESAQFVSNVFYINSLPQAGPVCIRNIGLTVVFNKEVDIGTLGGNIVVTDSSNGDGIVSGGWDYGKTKNIAIFRPSESCAPSSGDDCFKAETAYKLQFMNAAGIKTLTKNPELALNCQYKAGCHTVEFKSGLGVDRLPPIVSFVYPTGDTVLEPGTTVPVKLHYADDNGIQNLSLSYSKGTGDAVFVNSVSLAGCKQSDDVVLSWPTSSVLPGTYSLQAVATDWAGLAGADKQDATIRPGHCFNDTKDADEEGIDCGGASGCGRCAGNSCSFNSQCTGSCVNGLCRDVMRIDGFSPASGAPGTYVSISGHWFGEIPGKVYFSTTPNPQADNANDWKEAKVVNCGNTIDNWSNRQILVEVPVSAAASSQIKVVGAPVLTDGVMKSPVDTTALHSLPNFEVSTLVRPGICILTPNNGQTGDAITVIGKNFGTLQNASDKVLFGELKAVIAANQNNTVAWAPSQITAIAPSLAGGAVGVSVIKDGVPSNSVRFSVVGGVSAAEPFISEITPGKGAGGGYITITGGNFGNTVGSVWFKASPTSGAIVGSFIFPPACQASLWSDKKIIVKFPSGVGVADKSYLVQINTSANKTSALDLGKTFILEAGDPAPGLCAITPLSGPIPYPAGQTIKLSGEYFLTVLPGGQTGAMPTDVYFWNGSGNPNSITGRTVADRASSFTITTTSITLRPPSDTISGAVSVYRGNDQKISNPVNFTAKDCRTSSDVCSTGSHCCVNGEQAGMCKLNSELCIGESKTAGYVWRFSTKDLPPVPHVVERCDAVTQSGAALPTPTPSIQWDANNQGEHHAVCSGALSVVEFSTLIDQNTVNAQNVVINRCTAVDGKNNCTNPVAQTLTTGSYHLEIAQNNHSYLALQNTKPWDNGIWYQVVLKNKIKSAVAVGDTAIALSIDRACGGDSSYCFVFQGGGKQCVLDKVVVTPYNYLTDVLEAPMKKRTMQGVGAAVDYIGGGLSSQRCIMMDVSGYNWSWKSGDIKYTDIFGMKVGQTVNVSANGNTVGIGLPGNSVSVEAIAATSSDPVAKKGFSPLTVDLANLKEVDHWPKCQEACTDADVAIQFNVSLSDKNLDDAIKNGAVQLNKCLDEICLSVTPVGVSGDVYVDKQFPYTVLHIANSAKNSVELEPNQYYQVVISASSTNSNVKTQVWSRAVLNDASSFSKPYNQQFTWQFKTKKDKCVVNRVAVTPLAFEAKFALDRQIFSSQPYSSPDKCSTEGQKMNPWKMDWTWNSMTVDGKASAANIATVTTFQTKVKNNYCTNVCIKKGSTLSSVSSQVSLPACGNGVVEAGEDCDIEDVGTKDGCGLNCRRLGNSDKLTCGNGRVEANLGETCDPGDKNSRIGCSATCLHLGSAVLSPLDVSTGSSVCGNGLVGSGEDCDLGVKPDIANFESATGCSAKCLHLGTNLINKWCADNLEKMGGFSIAEYKSACDKAYSQCGDGMTSPDEDEGCEKDGGGKHATWCNDYCLANIKDHAKLNCTTKFDEGCDANGQYLGSSLSYTAPSVCGDMVAGIGEDASCETLNLTSINFGFTNPWALVVGVGRGAATGNPPAQRAYITAATLVSGASSKNVSGSGQFIISCGHKTDAECQAINSDYGVGKDTCCYTRPKLVSPQTPTDKSANVCLNTAIQAKFDQAIDPATVPGNLIIARSFGPSTAPCAPANDVSSLVFLAQLNEKSSWLKNVVQSVYDFARVIFGEDALATIYSSPKRWCKGDDLGTATVKNNPDGSSIVDVAILKPLASSTNYAIILKPEIKDVRGVSIGQNGNLYINWKFDTRKDICSVDAVTVEPTEIYFSKVNAMADLRVTASFGGLAIQSLPGFYSWDYLWSPLSNDVVSVPNVSSEKNTIAAKNHNGEVTIRAAAHLLSNIFTSATGTLASASAHAVVYLCEKPWPPKDAFIGDIGSKKGPYTIFPYEDNLGNNDNFDFSIGEFTNTEIPPSMVSAPGVGDGYFNFRTYYCADQTGGGSLPYLAPAVQADATALPVPDGRCEVSGDSCQLDKDCASNKCFKFPVLKRFIFTNPNNNDAIGIQIFNNPNHLTPSAWYAQKKSSGGQGFTGTVQATQVGGYDAVSDGNNVYIGALNLVEKNLYDLIYVISINGEAKPETTRKVFEALVKNMTFTTNLTNDQIQKLQRDYQRLRDMQTLDKALTAYSNTQKQAAIVANNPSLPLYPDLKSGTYLKGQTLSTWASWSVLADALKVALPVDPINQLGLAGTCTPKTGNVEALCAQGECNTFCTTDVECGSKKKCTLHTDPGTNTMTTGWSTADRRFSFACATSSYAYRYQSLSGADFTLRANIEDVGVPISNLSDFLAGYKFSDLKNFTGLGFNSVLGDTGICNMDQEISTISVGTCGDGQINVNTGEQCDPPGSIKFGDCVDGNIEVKQCTAGTVAAGGCRSVLATSWNGQTIAGSIPCSALSKCGNNIKETGETCDDGGLNGKYNHCNTNCTGKVSAYDPSKPSVSPGYCGDGQLNSTFELCDSTYIANQAGTAISIYPRAGFEADKTKSCNADCQNYGPYCGDGVVQAADEEACDTALVEKCDLGTGKEAVKPCSADCRTQWQCAEVPHVVAAASTAPVCGDGVVDATEFCDNGTKNGVVCVPGYGKACSYCAGDCKRSTDVQPTQYCGNGKIEGGEVCETTAGIVIDKTHLTGVLTCEQEQDPADSRAFKKGTKICANNCTAILVKETGLATCVACGYDENRGVTVSGNILNVLEAASTTGRENPLYATLNDMRMIGLYGMPIPKPLVAKGPSIANDFHVYSPDPAKRSSKYTLQYQLYDPVTKITSKIDAKLSPDAMCYAGDPGKNYHLAVNEPNINDIKNPFLFPIKTPQDAKPWQYDLLLSPVISAAGLNDGPVELVNSGRPHDIRIVVSWVGEAVFNSGFVKPFGVRSTVETLGFNRPATTGFDYYGKNFNDPVVSPPITWNIWYHGRGQTPGLLSTESYTLNWDSVQGVYAFYVRTADGSAIKNTLGAKLRVDVYVPVEGARQQYYTFSKPAKSFEFVLADKSDNPAASYWEVLKINRDNPSTITADHVETVTTDLENGRIVTSAAQF